MLTDGIHGVGREFEDAVEHEGTALEEDVAPVPAIVLDDVVSLCLNPDVERDEDESAEPPVRVYVCVMLWVE